MHAGLRQRAAAAAGERWDLRFVRPPSLIASRLENAEILVDINNIGLNPPRRRDFYARSILLIHIAIEEMIVII
ncbi:hypothetical protein [Chromobacterium aquaticum]|uniref:Uncharacterized protein n=1 Tax=Chromobacterium aquaticum TaxID=467180 RepID=A0ABV8ZNQ0_9NEIS|nr:hypothetical protein [Chromobacterium aquaticum]MCD5364325.1 hypothetical protein [Chromobacterium aquaticum]